MNYKPFTKKNFRVFLNKNKNTIFQLESIETCVGACFIQSIIDKQKNEGHTKFGCSSFYIDKYIWPEKFYNTPIWFQTLLTHLFGIKKSLNGKDILKEWKKIEV